MAATIGKVITRDSSGRVKETHRLGSQEASAEANTWVTFAKVTVYKDGSGYVTVAQNGKSIIYQEWGPELPRT